MRVLTFLRFHILQELLPHTQHGYRVSIALLLKFEIFSIQSKLGHTNTNSIFLIKTIE